MKICIVSDSHDRAEPLAKAIAEALTVAYGGSLKQAGLDGHVIQPKRLQDIAGK